MTTLLSATKTKLSNLYVLPPPSLQANPTASLRGGFRRGNPHERVLDCIEIPEHTSMGLPRHPYAQTNPSFLAMTVFICIILFTSCTPKIQYDKVRKPPKHGLITPPGTVWLKDSLFMDKYEVTNEAYRIYMWWYLKIHNQKNNAPDSLVWDNTRDKWGYHYYRHPFYDNFPVVGIDYKKSIDYCRWRSYVTNLDLYISSNRKFKKQYFKQIDSAYQVPEFVRYRLPTKQEWEYAAHAGLDSNNYPYGYESILYNNKPVSMTLVFELLTSTPIYRSQNDSNYYLYTSKKGYIGRQLIPSSTNFSRPNKFGIYDMLGNVSELVQDTLVKGFNYLTSLTGNKLDGKLSFPYNYSTQLYEGYNDYNIYSREFKFTKPTNYIGFRCICEVLKNP